MHFSEENIVNPDELVTKKLLDHQVSIEGPTFSKEEILSCIQQFSGIEANKLILTKKVVVASTDEGGDKPVVYSFVVDSQEAFLKYDCKHVEFKFMTKGYYEGVGDDSDTDIEVLYLDNNGEVEFAEIMAYWNPQKNIWQDTRPEWQTLKSEEYFYTNPYSEDTNLYTPAHAKKALKLMEAMGENATEIDEKKLAMTNSEVLREVKSMVYKKIESLKNNSEIARDYHDRLHKFPSEKIVQLVARYIVQTYRELPSNSADIESIDFVVESGMKKFIQAYRVDIPLYDNVYKEFDQLRDKENKPTEVYLGRDGIYAFMGRRAQDVSRRRKMGRDLRLKMVVEGKKYEKGPKYLVYPRFFRDELTSKQKVEYLLQQGIVRDADPVFLIQDMSEQYRRT